MIGEVKLAFVQSYRTGASPSDAIDCHTQDTQPKDWRS